MIDSTTKTAGGSGSLPRVALESTVISHGLPYPQNLQTALAMEEIIAAEGGRPATVGVIAGEIVVGLSRAQIEHLATASGVRKVSRRDLPIVVARNQDGATTVATTAWAAHRAGIRVFATGGIGGVHRAAPKALRRTSRSTCRQTSPSWHKPRSSWSVRVQKPSSTCPRPSSGSKHTA